MQEPGPEQEAGQPATGRHYLQGNTQTPLERALEADRHRAEAYEAEQRDWAREGRDHGKGFRDAMRGTGRLSDHGSGGAP